MSPLAPCELLFLLWHGPFLIFEYARFIGSQNAFVLLEYGCSLMLLDNFANSYVERFRCDLVLSVVEGYIHTPANLGSLLPPFTQLLASMLTWAALPLCSVAAPSSTACMSKRRSPNRHRFKPLSLPPQQGAPAASTGSQLGRRSGALDVRNLPR